MNLHLQRLRKEAGYKKQSDFADALGVPHRRYASWERREAMMSLEQAYNCALALGCTLNDLVGMDSSRSYADAGQRQINEQYEDMNERGRGRAVDAVDDVHDNPKNLKSAAGLDAGGPARRQGRSA